MNKSLLTLVIIALLPFGANAAYTYNYVDTPAPVANNGTVTVTNRGGPYVTVTPTVADESHIATTAYVKGAYNDAIAAINQLEHNKLSNTLFRNSDVDDDITGIVGTETTEELLTLINGLDEEDLEDYEFKLVSLAGVLNGIKSRQVKIYTTWDDDSDSATTHVLLDTILPDDD